MVDLEDVQFKIIGDPSGAGDAVNKVKSSLSSLGASMASVGKAIFTDSDVLAPISY
jgi:hypothetical protein